ncbi:MAG: [FeFe] hydrogenase H-cluster maturation GTPase HydF [Lachnospiraceae bacterium]
MSMNNTPSSERVHIGIFGKRNAGKSSLINALTGQNLAIVSDVKGTTTDPVLKAMELLPLGPVVMIDTPGLDDDGELGELRIQKAYQVLNKTDIALLVVDGTIGMTDEDTRILKRIQDKKVPYVVVFNKADQIKTHSESSFLEIGIDKKHFLEVSASEGTNIYELKELLAHLVPAEENGRHIVADLVSPLDIVVLVVPIDKAAPKGRLILPQQQTIRDLLEAGAASIVVRDTELDEALKKLGQNPALVITDSQAFKKVSQIVPENVPLTSFSILFARYKGSLDSLVNGAKHLDQLKDNDTILISEGCTHHRQCDDIGTVKLPRWIKEYTKKELNFEFTSGTEFPLNLSKYQLIIHCGGCTLNEREMKYRMKCAEDAKIPMTNYGTAIAYMNGILERSLRIFK